MEKERKKMYERMEERSATTKINSIQSAIDYVNLKKNSFLSHQS